MTTDDSSIASLVVILLPLVLLICFITLVLVLRMSSRLRRLEALLAGQQMQERETAIPKRSESQKKEESDFDKFIAEDGTRRLLSKREQAAAFREWRRQRGITWGADEG